ncbi:MAG: magnesium transporter [Deltaproteobacteria bacterium]|nr:magnesium transporter [Deltaproteobacteria bacterium]
MNYTVSLKKPALEFARQDFPKLPATWSVQEALDFIREHGVGEKIVYFYVVDNEGRLIGVVPTRRLLTSPLEKQLAEIMISRMVTIPHTATLMDACEMFALYKFLAFPVVDEERRIVGVLDVGVFTDQVLDMEKRERMDEVFESIGFRISQIKDASPWRVFRFRFPWLLATISSGTFCALLASSFEMTLAKSLVLTFFLTLILGLGESVSMQSMTVTIQALRSKEPTLRWYVKSLRKEAATALLLGTACGTLVGLIAWLWRGEGLVALVICLSILLILLAACLLGLSIPTLLHALKLDVKIAAGPVTLASADILTLLFYFSMASFLLS